jgi:hypothetical protein
VPARTFEGGPPESAGRPLELVGDGKPRWMVAERDCRKAPGNRIRLTGRLIRIFVLLVGNVRRRGRFARSLLFFSADAATSAALGGTARGKTATLPASQDHLAGGRWSNSLRGDPVGCFLVRCAQLHFGTGLCTVCYERVRKRVKSHDSRGRGLPGYWRFCRFTPKVACPFGLSGAWPS